MRGAVLLAIGVSLLVVVYSAQQGPFLGGRVQATLPALVITEIEVVGEPPHRRAQVTFRNDRLYSMTAELACELRSSEQTGSAYTSPPITVGPLAAGATDNAELGLPNDVPPNPILRVWIRERLAYANEAEFDLSRITPEYSLVYRPRSPLQRGGK